MELSTIPQLFPAFEKELQREIQEQGEIRFFKSEEQLMRTGQYFRSSRFPMWSDRLQSQRHRRQ